ncbi:hypothetical protein EV192_1021053 [Actinocrispum wychmicini]|uniref:Uncharacterized protein n=1 Tax=Actinocrispum wychmicini TaxID=1213861 RepID=A0A4R2JRM2_9PSEU|nr:hypothetical protein EV192_1021053 [Actinocrispum wychmicini]
MARPAGCPGRRHRADPPAWGESKGSKFALSGDRKWVYYTVLTDYCRDSPQPAKTSTTPGATPTVLYPYSCTVQQDAYSADRTGRFLSFHQWSGDRTNSLVIFDSTSQQYLAIPPAAATTSLQYLQVTPDGTTAVTSGDCSFPTQWCGGVFTISLTDWVRSRQTN